MRPRTRRMRGPLVLSLRRMALQAAALVGVGATIGIALRAPHWTWNGSWPLEPALAPVMAPVSRSAAVGVVILGLSPPTRSRLLAADVQVEVGGQVVALLGTRPRALTVHPGERLRVVLPAGAHGLSLDVVTPGGTVRRPAAGVYALKQGGLSLPAVHLIP